MTIANSQGGFTFLEVMAAIVVISIMSLTAVYLVKNASDEFIIVSTRRHSYELAQEKMLGIITEENLNSYAGDAGVFDSDEDYSWESEVEQSDINQAKVLNVVVSNEKIHVKASLNYLFYSSQ